MRLVLFCKLHFVLHVLKFLLKGLVCLLRLHKSGLKVSLLIQQIIFLFLFFYSILSNLFLCLVKLFSNLLNLS